MKAQNVGTRIMVSILVLVFWLAILFLDGAFSARSSVVEPQVSDGDVQLMSDFSYSTDRIIQIRNQLLADPSYSNEIARYEYNAEIARVYAIQRELKKLSR